MIYRLTPVILTHEKVKIRTSQVEIILKTLKLEWASLRFLELDFTNDKVKWCYSISLKWVDNQMCSL